MATSGLHRSWLTTVYARSGNSLHSVRPLWDTTRFGAFSMAFCLSHVARTRLRVVAAQDARVLAATKNALAREFLEVLQGRSPSTGLGVRESCRMGRMPFFLLALGLYRSLREISRPRGL